MAQQMSTPRITAPYLQSFAGRVVMLVGKVTQLRGEQATLDADGTVTLLLNREAHLASGNGAQVIGKVNPDLTIKVLTARDLGTGVDYQLYASVVEATHRLKSIFVTDNCLAPPDHGFVNPSQPSYTPRVAMVWTTPTSAKTQQSPVSHSMHLNSSPSISSRQNIRPSYSSSVSSLSGYESSSYTRGSTPRPKTPVTARRLQYNPTTYTGKRPARPPSTSSFTTTSSLIRSEAEPRSRSPSPSYEDEPTRISKSPASSIRQMLPSPPLEDGDESAFSSQHSCISDATTEPYSYTSSFIPSAQPQSPIVPFSPHAFSPSSYTGSLPSPPPTQSQARRYPFEDSAPSTPTRPDPRDLPSRRTPRIPNPPRSSTSRLRIPNPAPLSSEPSSTDAELMDSVVEGIGRIHVTMRKDDAGRWRIRRNESRS